MQRIALAIAAAAAVVSAALVFHSAAHHTTDSSSMLVANIVEPERDLLKLADVSDCKDQAVAGEETRLDASGSKMAREELAQHREFVAHYCECKFHHTAKFMTKDEMIKQWLTTSSGFSEPLSPQSKGRLDRVVENCALKYGLRLQG
ncbi:MAG: hypothetical protein ACHQAQ_04490 [Hyphomicrobiales bacterium]